jgi:hypothetical protein
MRFVDDEFLLLSRSGRAVRGRKRSDRGGPPEYQQFTPDHVPADWSQRRRAKLAVLGAAAILRTGLGGRRVAGRPQR